MIRRHRVLALAVIAGLSLSACASNDAKRSDVVDAMTDAGLDQDQADCVGDGFEEEFGDDQDLFNDVAAASDPEDFPGDSEETVRSILDDCVQEDPSGDDASDSSDTTEPGDEGAGTTTTTAGG
jgi:hypothetical protein